LTCHWFSLPFASNFLAYNKDVHEPSPAPIKAVLFDYGVVLSGPPDPAAWTRMRKVTGLPEVEFRAAYWAPRHDYDRGFHTGAEYWLMAGRHAGLNLTPLQVTELLAADNALWTQVNQPMVDWALRLQAAGTPTGVLSNLGDAMTEGVLARQGWLSGFDHLVWSHSLKLAKPDPEIYRLAAAGFGYAPGNIFFIDDREDNVAGGAAAGMQVVHYTTQTAFEDEMVRRGLGELWRSGRQGTE
jgi:putative hydrolase of the HAD superfamily